MPKAFIVQRPRNPESFDMVALERLGEPRFILPAAPNVHDHERVSSDLVKMREAVFWSDPDDVFVTMGGSPLANMLFGAAIALEKKPIMMGLYSRSIDSDGRRGHDVGEYRVVPVKL